MHTERQFRILGGTKFISELKEALSFKDFVNEDKNPYFFIGENPTVDILIFRKNGKDSRCVDGFAGGRPTVCDQGRKRNQRI